MLYNIKKCKTWLLWRSWHWRHHHHHHHLYSSHNSGPGLTVCISLGPDHDSGLLPRSLSIIFNSIEGRLYSRADLKPQRCRDFSRLTPDQQAAESSSKKNLLRLLKEVRQKTYSGCTGYEDVMGSTVSVLCLCRATEMWCLEDQLFLKVSEKIFTLEMWGFISHQHIWDLMKWDCLSFLTASSTFLHDQLLN